MLNMTLLLVHITIEVTLPENGSENHSILVAFKVELFLKETCKL